MLKQQNLRSDTWREHEEGRGGNDVDDRGRVIALRQRRAPAVVADAVADDRVEPLVQPAGVAGVAGNRHVAGAIGGQNVDLGLRVLEIQRRQGSSGICAGERGIRKRPSSLRYDFPKGGSGAGADDHRLVGGEQEADWTSPALTIEAEGAIRLYGVRPLLRWVLRDRPTHAFIHDGNAEVAVAIDNDETRNRLVLSVTAVNGLHHHDVIAVERGVIKGAALVKNLSGSYGVSRVAGVGLRHDELA